MKIYVIDLKREAEMKKLRTQVNIYICLNPNYSSENYR